ncbi:MAG TPA: hypothetical protein VFT76_01905, partial [Actinomycetota bacterium]|nr:hypothetical protein [Actinomycetota bacterium]
AAANPGLGIRISEDAIRAERAILSDGAFARERLGIWPTVGDERAIPPELWDRATLADVEAVRDRASLGVDATPDHSAAAIAAFGGDVGELVERREGVGWVLERVVEIAVRHKAVVSIAVSSPAAFLVPALEARRVKVRKIAAAEEYAACARIYEAIADARFVARTSADLEEAVGRLRKKTVSGDRFTWRRDLGDVCAFTALTLAFGPAAPRRSEPWVAFG